MSDLINLPNSEKADLLQVQVDEGVALRERLAEVAPDRLPIMDAQLNYLRGLIAELRADPNAHRASA